MEDFEVDCSEVELVIISIVSNVVDDADKIGSTLGISTTGITEGCVSDSDDNGDLEGIDDDDDDDDVVVVEDFS